MKKLIATIATVILIGIAPIVTATPAQARGGEGWWPQITKPAKPVKPIKRGGEIIIDPKPTCPQIVKVDRFFRVVECNPNA